MHRINPGHNEATWIVLTLQGLWRAGMLISRIAVLVLTAICLREWSLLFLGFHWLFMTIWVLLQNTDFCYYFIIGFIYCFDFFNLRVGKSRYRVFVFYSVIVIENIAFLIVFVLCFKDAIKAEEIAVMTSLIIGGMIIGLTSMLFYYGKFHPSKIGGMPNVTEGRSEPVTNKAVTPRSFKQYYPNSFASSSCSIDHSQKTTSEEITTDKQYLLTNIVQNSECTESGVVNQTCQIESEPAATAICLVSECEPAHNISKDETTSTKNTFPVAADNVACEYLEIQNDCNDSSEKDIHRQKRRGICTKHDELKDSRSLGNICEDINGIAMLRERLETPTIFNDSCEKITTEETEKLTKELQQRDETMSCVTSIHDYENVCPLGVARPPWCIRSWKGYTDIETYIHDDSVVRDRRRDTLTSTTTGTTYSSEFSDTTCASSLLRGILKQDDYLDTLTYDLIDSRELKPTYNDDLPAKRVSGIDEQNPTLYIAKPVVIDDKGGMFALDTILEEHDEITADEKFEYTQSGSDSVSTLVSTIDQIRRYTAENSPRHVYHTTGSQWEDFDPKNLIKRAQLTKALFKNEAATCNRNYINCLDESESIQVRGKREIDAISDLVKYCTTIESFKKTPLIEAILSDSPILGNKAKLQKQASIACQKDEFDSKENDLYVEMSPLVPVENVKKFESKSQLVYVVTPNNAIKIEQSAASSEADASKKNVSVILKKSSDCTKCDKENLAPVATFRASHEKNTSNDRSHSNRENVENDKSLCGGDLNLKERRHIFLEQVLSPPKLLTWNKKKSVSGSTVKKPA
ncbi:XK-related protein 5 [Melipona quadrifasciata]|uniref:XK-related protein n=1 Tax=Melipona quadrifasciata TaxID=166423 RepID=A0A0N0BJN7_9HYME|nr:XK-related protein 5 [Melipona quadrifasciata]